MLLRPFGRELLCFEYLVISLLDLTGICCCIEKISLQQQIPLMKARMPERKINHLFLCVYYCLFSSRCGVPYLLKISAVEPLLPFYPIPYEA